MGAYAAGRRAVMTEFDTAPEPLLDAAGSEPAAPKPRKPPPSAGDPRDGSLATIADTIPSEGLAFFLSFYGLFLATIDAWPPWARPWLAFGTIVGGVVVTVAFALAPGIKDLRSKRNPKNRAAALNRLIVRSALFSVLLVIYIAATPQNPFILILNWPLLPGTVVAALAAFAIIKFSQLRNLIAGEPKKE